MFFVLLLFFFVFVFFFLGGGGGGGGERVGGTYHKQTAYCSTSLVQMHSVSPAWVLVVSENCTYLAVRCGPVSRGR